MSDTCRACSAPLIWAITKDGKRAPINREPSPEGNVLLFKAPMFDTDAPVAQARTFAGFALDELRAQGVPLRTNHFSDCPERERFKR